MQTIKNELKNINDELLDFYNKPSMALHFQPTNLKKLKEIIEKLIFLEDVLDKYPAALEEFNKRASEQKG
jgi:hypothetical protein|tara:strand:- start:210 stop:419 length:210 start_codon:yes stop_codon:yes gene_type:complete